MSKLLNPLIHNRAGSFLLGLFHYEIKQAGSELIYLIYLIYLYLFSLLFLLCVGGCMHKMGKQAGAELCQAKHSLS